MSRKRQFIAFTFLLLIGFNSVYAQFVEYNKGFQSQDSLKGINEWLSVDIPTHKNIPVLKSTTNDVLDYILGYTYDDFLSKLVLSEKFEYEYYDDGNRHLRFKYSHDESTGNWNISEKREYLNYKHDNACLIIDYSWNENLQKWIGLKKEELDYDENKNWTLRAKYDWDATNQKWIGTGTKEVYVYDNNFRRTLSEYYGWDAETSVWIGTRKEIEVYADEYISTLRESYVWDKQQNDWKGENKNEFLITSNGENCFQAASGWSDEINDWNIGSFSEADMVSTGSWSIGENTIVNLSNYGKIEPKYDANNHLVEIILFEKQNAGDEWSKKNKYDCRYNAAGENTLTIRSYWDNITNDWVEDRTTIVVRNKPGDCIYQQVNVVCNYIQVIDEFDANSLKTKSTYKYRLTESEIWKNALQLSFINTTQNIGKVIYLWDDGEDKWYADDIIYSTGLSNHHYRGDLSQVKWDILTDNNDNISNLTFWQRNDDNQEWVNFKFQNLSWNEYNGTSHCTLNESFNWDATNNHWEKERQSIYDYDSDGNQILYESYQGDAESNTWRGSMKYERDFESGNNILNAWYLWDFDRYDWYGRSKQTITYNSEGYRDTYSNYAWDIYKWDWYVSKEYSYHYKSNTPTSISKDGVQQILVYPNPSKGIVTINGVFNDHEALVIDLAGKQVFREKINTHQTIDLTNHCSSGIYLMKIIDSDSKTIHTSKLIIN